MSFNDAIERWLELKGWTESTDQCRTVLGLPALMHDDSKATRVRLLQRGNAMKLAILMSRGKLAPFYKERTRNAGILTTWVDKCLEYRSQADLNVAAIWLTKEDGLWAVPDIFDQKYRSNIAYGTVYYKVAGLDGSPIGMYLATPEQMANLANRIKGLL